MKPIVYLLLICSLINYGLLTHKSSRYLYPENFKIDDFPLVQQPDEISCGPASALMVLRSISVNATLEQIKSKSKTEWFVVQNRHIGMTSPDYLTNAIKSFGVNASRTQGSINKLKYHVSHHGPVIVLIRSGKEYWHYFVVIGYTANEIIVADPAYGAERSLNMSHFIASWAFLADSSGNVIAEPCRFCGGDGYLLPKKLGPIGICDFCSGTGVQLDYMGRMIKLSDVNPFTMITINTK